MDLGILINNEKLYLVEIGPNFVSSTVIRGNSDIIIIKFSSAIDAKYWLPDDAQIGYGVT